MISSCLGEGFGRYEKYGNAERARHRRPEGRSRAASRLPQQGREEALLLYVLERFLPLLADTVSEGPAKLLLK